MNASWLMTFERFVALCSDAGTKELTLAQLCSLEILREQREHEQHTYSDWVALYRLARESYESGCKS